MGSPSANVQSEAHAALTRAAAAQGMVLLKNDDGILPLDGNRIRSIAVFGAAAEVSSIVVGGGSAPILSGLNIPSSMRLETFILPGTRPKRIPCATPRQ